MPEYAPSFLDGGRDSRAVRHEVELHIYLDTNYYQLYQLGHLFLDLIAKRFKPAGSATILQPTAVRSRRNSRLRPEDAPVTKTILGWIWEHDSSWCRTFLVAISQYTNFIGHNWAYFGHVFQMLKRKIGNIIMEKKVLIDPKVSSRGCSCTFTLTLTFTFTFDRKVVQLNRISTVNFI